MSDRIRERELGVEGTSEETGMAGYKWIWFPQTGRPGRASRDRNEPLCALCTAHTCRRGAAVGMAAAPASGGVAAGPRSGSLAGQGTACWWAWRALAGATRQVSIGGVRSGLLHFRRQLSLRVYQSTSERRSGSWRSPNAFCLQDGPTDRVPPKGDAREIC